MSAQRRVAGIAAASVLTALVMTAWDLTTDPVMAGTVGAWVWVDGGPYFGIPMENFLGWVVVVAVICLVYRWTEPAVPLRPMGSPKRWIALGPLIGYGTMALGDALVGLPASRLWSLLLEVAESRATARRTGDLAAQWDRDRFVRPSVVDQRTLMVVDRQLLSEVLGHTSGNLTQAAKILGITRATLRAKLTALGLASEKDAGAGDP